MTRQIPSSLETANIRLIKTNSLEKSASGIYTGRIPRDQGSQLRIFSSSSSWIALFNETWIGIPGLSTEALARLTWTRHYVSGRVLQGETKR